MSAAAHRIRAAAAARWAMWKANDDTLVRDFCTAGMLAFILLGSSPWFGG